MKVHMPRVEQHEGDMASLLPEPCFIQVEQVRVNKKRKEKLRREEWMKEIGTE